MRPAPARFVRWRRPSRLYILFLLLPIYWLINMSLKTNTEITSRFTLWPRNFTSPTTR